MRYVNGALILFVIVLVAGCNNQTIIEDDKPVSDFGPPKKEEIVIWHTYSDAETNVFENILIPLFEKEFPKIDVIPVRQSYNEQLKSAIIARASANTPPDIVRMDIAWVPFFAQLDLLYPVSKFKVFEKIKGEFYKDSLRSNYYNGEYYGIPLNTNTKVSIYNKELLEKAGYENPPETMEELVNMIEKHQYVLGITGFTSWETLHYFYGLGGVLTDSAYTQATGYLDSDKSIKAVKKLLSLFKSGYLSPQIMTRSPDTWGGVLNGNYFMIDEGPWFYSVNSEEEISYINEVAVSAPFPITDGKRAVLGGESLVITKGSKHRQSAWTFLQWMTDEKAQTYLAKTGLIPSNKNVELSGFYDQYPYYQAYIDSLNDTILRPPIGQWSRIDGIYTEYMRMILSESISVEEGLKEAAIQMDQILQTERGR